MYSVIEKATFILPVLLDRVDVLHANRVCWEVRITFSYNKPGCRVEKRILIRPLLVAKVCIKKKKKVQVFQNYYSPSMYVHCTTIRSNL